MADRPGLCHWACSSSAWAIPTLKNKSKTPFSENHKIWNLMMQLMNTDQTLLANGSDGFAAILDVIASHFVPEVFGLVPTNYQK